MSKNNSQTSANVADASVQDSSPQIQLTPVQRAIMESGVFAVGKGGSMIFMPLAVLMTRKQVAPPGTTYSTIVQEILKECGPKGFYKGGSPTILRLMGKEGMTGPITKNIAHETQSYLPESVTKNNSEAGFIISAPVSAAISTYGLGFLDRIRIYSMTSQGSGVMQFFKDTYKNGGLFGAGKEMYRGATTSYASSVIGTAGYHFLHQEFKKIIQDLNGEPVLSKSQETAISIGAGSIMTAVRSPLAVISSVIMQKNSPITDASITKAAKHVFKAHGVKGFFVGIGPAIGLGGISSLVYQGSLDLIAKIEEMERAVNLAQEAPSQTVTKQPEKQPVEKQPETESKTQFPKTSVHLEQQKSETLKTTERKLPSRE